MSNLTNTREIITNCANCGEPIVFEPEYADWVNRNSPRAEHYVNICSAGTAGHTP